MDKDKLSSIFCNIPTLKGRRITLRAMHPIDAEDMYSYASRQDVTEYLLWSPHESVKYTKDYLRYVQTRYALGDLYDWAVIHRESRRMIGTCGFVRIDIENRCAEVGYVINPEFRGQGYAPEAVGMVLRFGFERLGLHRIEARFMEGNAASYRVMSKLGMTFEGYHRESVFSKGRFVTVGYCSITEDEYKNRAKCDEVDTA